MPEFLVLEQFGEEPAEAESSSLSGFGFAVEVRAGVRGGRDAGDVAEVARGETAQGERAGRAVAGLDEFFYRLTGADVGFDPDYPVSLDTGPRIRTKNAGNLLGLDAADVGQCPTQWQKFLYPVRYHPMLEVIHEGIDTTLVVPDAHARVQPPGGAIELDAEHEVVTYVARNLDLRVTQMGANA